MEKQIIYKKITDIKPYEKNPRKNDDAVEAVSNSIKEFGFKVPIVIDKNGIIVAGHTRYKASKKLGIDTIPCIVADDLTDEQIKAFRLSDNKVSEAAEWDFNLLSLELKDLKEHDFDLGLTGFNIDEIDSLLSTNEDIEDNDYEEQDLKENSTQLHKCPECGCEFED